MLTSEAPWNPKLGQQGPQESSVLCLAVMEVTHSALLGAIEIESGEQETLTKCCRAGVLQPERLNRVVDSPKVA
ncbi:hypothetical protein TgHK011_003727 [Trichoderma gracile]|nr:hypothetical protein TgHK011_003727 [Trichoderma gracile]